MRTGDRQNLEDKIWMRNRSRYDGTGKCDSLEIKFLLLNLKVHWYRFALARTGQEFDGNPITRGNARGQQSKSGALDLPCLPHCCVASRLDGHTDRIGAKALEAGREVHKETNVSFHGRNA
jgi:hypothetical protein